MEVYVQHRVKARKWGSKASIVLGGGGRGERPGGDEGGRCGGEGKRVSPLWTSSGSVSSRTGTEVPRAPLRPDARCKDHCKVGGRTGERGRGGSASEVTGVATIWFVELGSDPERGSVRGLGKR